MKISIKNVWGGISIQ